MILLNGSRDTAIPRAECCLSGGWGGGMLPSDHLRGEERFMRREMTMKRIGLVMAGLLVGGAACLAQDVAPGRVANPVTTNVKGQLTRYEKNMVAAADLMPAEKYSFKPTSEMNSFGHVVMHIAQSNNFLCSKISGAAAPDLKLTDADGKDKLVAA